MIVAFYPGSGGHRYKLFLQNQFFSKRGGNMHHEPMHIQYAEEHTVATQLFDTDTIQLTHTLNTAIIKRLWPGHEIRKIKFDFKRSLCREWEVEMKYHWNHRTHKEQVAQMFDMIVWHHDYYKTQDWDCDMLVDISTDTSEFGNVMRKELDLHNLDFDFAWDCYVQYGANAPMDDLYDQR
jgi:hypothetical protein